MNTSFDAASSALVLRARELFEAYAIGQLQGPTQQRYFEALVGFREWCRRQCPAFDKLPDADKDFVLAFYCLEDLFEEDAMGGLAAASDLVVALQKLNRTFVTKPASRFWSSGERSTRPCKLALCLRLLPLRSWLCFA